MENKPGFVGNILLIDDTSANLRLLTEILQKEGYRVRAVLDGTMGISAAQNQPPDLILLDIGLPNMDGYEVCRRLKADPKTAQVPVIFISAMDSVEDKVAALIQGGVDYITKPFHAMEILIRVNIHLKINKLNQELQHARDNLENLVQQRTSELVRTNAALQAFLPHEFLKLLGKKSVAEVSLGDGVLREMTTMFCDIRGFTSRSEVLGPKKTFEFLNDFLGRIVPAIQNNGGIIDKFLGDGVLALFDDSPEKALLAATLVVMAVQELNVDLEKQGLEKVEIGIGVHQGPCMLGIIGERERLQGTVIADAVNLASRIQELTKDYGVPLLVSQNVFDAMRDKTFFEYRFVDCINVRGRKDPVCIFELFTLETPKERARKVIGDPLYTQIVKLLRGGKVDPARELLKELLAMAPEDRLYQKLQERSEWNSLR